MLCPLRFHLIFSLAPPTPSVGLYLGSLSISGNSPTADSSHRRESESAFQPDLFTHQNLRKAGLPRAPRSVGTLVSWTAQDFLEVMFVILSYNSLSCSLIFSIVVVCLECKLHEAGSVADPCTENLAYKGLQNYLTKISCGW